MSELKYSNNQSIFEWTHLITKLDTCAYGDLAWIFVSVPNLLTRFLAYLDWWDVNIPFCDCFTYPTHLKLIFISLENLWVMSTWLNTITKHNVIRIDICKNKLIPYFYNKIVPRWSLLLPQFFIQKKKILILEVRNDVNSWSMCFLKRTYTQQFLSWLKCNSIYF